MPILSIDNHIIDMCLEQKFDDFTPSWYYQVPHQLVCDNSPGSVKIGYHVMFWSLTWKKTDCIRSLRRVTHCLKIISPILSFTVYM